ncbi:hypothetical protein OH76DRAFT_1436523 [Lentinus brumalis]|uniref:Uncharacterized protein n=1 Tax=Lentinus brumalis TaxID=2498619 RepID=A0A371DE77_9APHY|nr:hypothetical protein OH76DRAFT_1436523 [Polyporus brumalis]
MPILSDYSYQRSVSSSGNDLIPSPHSRPKRVYVGDGEKSSLQEQMGMLAAGGLLSEILLAIRKTCLSHGVDMNLAYRRQNAAVLRAVTQDLLDNLPVLREYQDGWPIEFYLARELKSHRSRPASSRYLRLRPEQRRSQTPYTMNYGRQTACSRMIRARRTKTVLGRPVKRVTRPPSRSESPSTIDRDESDVERQLRPASEIYMMTPPPSPHSEPSTSSYSQPIFNILVTALVPPTDAQRLTELLASKGITNLAYMRVLARMSTRDSWLEELVREEKITEIQMRVLQEILEGHK